MRASLALFLAIFPAAAPAQPLGTLFHTPEERRALDRLRRGEPAEPTTVSRAAPAVTGYVKRSDGKSTVFLDRQPYPARGQRTQELLEPRIVDRPDVPAAPGPNPQGKGS